MPEAGPREVLPRLADRQPRGVGPQSLQDKEQSGVEVERLGALGKTVQQSIEIAQVEILDDAHVVDSSGPPWATVV